MRIDGWHIDGFGIFCDYAERGLAPGLVVFLGPNEAGKSTVLAFLRGVLFGFPTRRAASRYPPLRGGQHGGRVFLESPQGMATVERRSAGRAKLRVLLDGKETAPEVLAEIMGGVDDKLFRSVFAFSLDELHSLETLDDEQIRERIYSAHVVGAGRPAKEVTTALDAEMAILLRPRGASRLGDLGQRAAEIGRQWEEARERSERYPALSREVDAHANEVGTLTLEVLDLQNRQRYYESLLALWPAWSSRNAPGERRQTLSAQLDGRLEAITPAVESHHATLALQEERRRQLAEADRGAARIEQDLAACLGPIGWSIELLQGVDLARLHSEARDLGRRLTEAEMRLVEYRRMADAARGETLRLEAALLDHCAKVDITDIEERDRALPRVRSRLSELISQERTKEALEEAQSGRSTRDTVARQVYTGLMIGGLLAAAVVWDLFRGGLSWITLVVAVLAAAALLLRRLRRRQPAPDDLSPRIAATGARIDELRASILTDSELLGFNAQPTEEELETAGAAILRDKVALSARSGLSESLDRVKTEGVRSQQVESDASAIAAQSTEAWHVWLTVNRLPAGLTPADASQHLAGIESARHLLDALAAARTTRERLAYAIAAWDAPVSSWMEATGESSFAALHGRCLKDRVVRQELAALDQARGETDFPPELVPSLESGQIEEWRRDLIQIGERLVEVQEQRDEALGRLRLSENARTELEQSAEVATFETELETVRADIASAAREWVVAAMARGLVQRTLAEYTRQHQPGVLREASAAFERVTAGLHRSIVQQEDGESLMIADRNGAMRRPEELSRGTMEQLFLCLRLGLAGEFGKRSVPLPLVMDDVLVNFDPSRASAMAAEIRRFAEQRQVLYFTCHPETARLMSEGGAPMIELGQR